MAHQQESFLPFPSQQSLSCCLSHVAERSTPKPHGPLPFPQNRMVLPIYSRSSWPSPFPFRTAWSSPPMDAVSRFKSQCPSSFAAPFPTPPTVSYTCQHPVFFQLYWAAIVSLGRCGLVAWSQSSPSSHSGAVTRGSCFPDPSWVEVTPISLAQSRATAIEHIYETS